MALGLSETVDRVERGRTPVVDARLGDDGGFREDADAALICFRAAIRR